MANITVKKAMTADLEELSQFACIINGIKERSSNFCYKDPEHIRQEFKESINSGNLVECRIASHLVGILNCYVDHEKHNADCSLLIEAGQNYDSIAKLLLDETRKQFDSSMKYTFFFPKENTDCSNFLDKIGAHREVNEYCLLLKLGNLKLPTSSYKVAELPEEYYNQFISLHDSIFPEIYISGKEVINDIGKNHYIYAIIENGQIIAYSVLRSGGKNRVTAEIVAVRDGFRRKGYGRVVLSYLACQAFDTYGMDYVDLIVDSDNENAIKLYLDLGFVVESENCCYTIRQ